MPVPVITTDRRRPTLTRCQWWPMTFAWSGSPCPPSALPSASAGHRRQSGAGVEPRAARCGRARQVQAHPRPGPHRDARRTRPGPRSSMHTQGDSRARASLRHGSGATGQGASRPPLACGASRSTTARSPANGMQGLVALAQTGSGLSEFVADDPVLFLHRQPRTRGRGFGPSQHVGQLVGCPVAGTTIETPPHCAIPRPGRRMPTRRWVRPASSSSSSGMRSAATSLARVTRCCRASTRAG